MTITGYSLIGSETGTGGGATFHAIEAATAQPMAPAFASTTPAELDRACALAAAAFDIYRETTLEARAAFLEGVAQAIADIGDELIIRAVAETGLPRPRLEGERGRTMGQLRLFAGVVRDGGFLDVRIDPVLPERKPVPRVDLRLRNIPLGPVAVFGASNFPLAFSVAGGDTASALAAGCPVIVKAHPAHPGTSELVGRAVQKVVADHGLPEGVFSLLFDDGRAIAQALVADARVAAVGFTGSRAGGLALVGTAQTRRVPIPVYAEMSSINPVLLFPHALAARGPAIAQAFVASLALGAGQFCTNPGLLIAVRGPALDAFLHAAATALAGVNAATMLTPGICAAYRGAVEHMAAHPTVTLVGRGLEGVASAGQAALFAVDATAFLADRTLAEEMFGAAGLVVRCDDGEQMRSVLHGLEGQLTAALQMDEADHEAARDLLPLLEQKAGRILVNGFGTGVEVAHAMVHGGPYPATSDGRSTSVGSLAIRRFLRPVCYQDFPDGLLPEALARDNRLGLRRMVDGAMT